MTDETQTECKHESRILQERGFWKSWKCRSCGEWVDPPEDITSVWKPSEGRRDGA